MSADEVRLAEARRQLAHLANLPVVPARIEPVPTGELFRDRWQRLGQHERNQWLRMVGVKALVLQNPLQVALVSRGEIEKSAKDLTATMTDF